MADYFIPIITAAILLWAWIKKVDIFGEFASGVREGLENTVEIAAPLIFLVTAIGLFKGSGLTDALTELLSPLMNTVGFPPECLKLAVIRPISGSGAVAVFESILRESSPDSFAGRVASVMLGSSETTFYTLAVYFGAVKVRNTRHALTASLIGDITGFMVSAAAVRFFMYG